MFKKASIALVIAVVLMNFETNAQTHKTVESDINNISKKPNIVLIYADDMGWGDVGYHGFNDISTPNIDKLASEGTQFSQGYVCASVCGPSRSGLLTGVYQQRMGVYGNGGGTHVPKSQSLLFEILKKQGYHTGAVGKWGIGDDVEDVLPNSRGVDFYYGFLGGSHSYTKSSLVEHSEKKPEAPIWRNGNIEPPIQNSNGYLTEMFTNEAVGYIESTSNDKPFCLYLAYNAVHFPWVVPQKYRDRLKHLNLPNERELFAGMTLALDDGLGAIMKALEKKGVADNTLVIFVSDNGSPRGQGLVQPKIKTTGTTTMSSP